jgi:hypothetical protein
MENYYQILPKEIWISSTALARSNVGSEFKSVVLP